MILWAPFAGATALLCAYGLSCDLRRWCRGFLDDLERAHHVREMEADGRQQKLAVEPAGHFFEPPEVGMAREYYRQQINIAEELGEEAAFGDNAWTLSDIADTFIAIDHLTRYDASVWERTA